MKPFLIEHMSVMFGLICKYAEVCRGDEGLAIMDQVTERYAKERGHRMALRALANGDPLTMENYIAYGELNTSADPSKQDFRITKREPVYENEVHDCPYHNARVKYGLGKYSAQYCPGIDYFLVKGFNPELTMDCEQTIGGGAPYCLHRWNGFPATGENWERVQKRRRELKPTCSKDMLFHTAHVYFSAKDSLAELMSEKESDIITENAMHDFAEIYGEESAEAVLSFADTDFHTI